MKQTFNIPNGCSTVPVEQAGNQLITTFEPEKYVPKKGDVCVWNESMVDKNSSYYCKYPIIGFFCDHLHITGLDMTRKLSFGLGIGDGKFRKATELEKQILLDNLNDKGYIYDFETNTASKKRWIPAVGDHYFIVSMIRGHFKAHKLVFEFNDDIDKNLLSESNYFQTEQQAEAAANFIKQQLKEFNNK